LAATLYPSLRRIRGRREVLPIPPAFSAAASGRGCRGQPGRDSTGSTVGLAEGRKLVRLTAGVLVTEEIEQRRAADVRDLLRRRTPQARQMLRKLLVGRLTVTAIEEQGQAGFRVTGQGTYGRLLSGEAFDTTNGDPGGSVVPRRKFWCLSWSASQKPRAVLAPAAVLRNVLVKIRGARGRG
jgi:hypothetical protein